MSIPAKPTITTPPPAPVRGQDRTTFANRANDYIAWIDTNVTDQTAVIDWQDTVFTATETEATNAANSASAAAASESNAATSESNAADSALLSEDWATTTGTTVDGAEYAAKEYAVGTTAPEGSAKQWATSDTEVVAGLRGAKYYADVAEAAVATLPEGTINDSVIATDKAWSSVKIAQGPLTRYDLTTISTTTELDLATGNQFTVDASSPRTLSFANAPAGRAMTVVITVSGANAITWPAGIRWHGDGTTAPELGASWTVVVLNWDGSNWSGVKGASA